MFSDADWAGDSSDRHSTSGVLITIGGGPVISISRKQNLTAQSSTEAEFIASNEAAKEISWLVQLLEELKLPFKVPLLLVDNQSTLRQIQNPDTKRRSKHISIKFNYVRELFQQNFFKLQYIETKNQAADILTKAVTGPTLHRHLTNLRCYQAEY